MKMRKNKIKYINLKSKKKRNEMKNRPNLIHFTHCQKIQKINL